MAGLAGLLAAGRISAPELVDRLLDRIQRLQPRLNAFRVVRGDLRAEAAEAQRLRDAGDPRPLLGVPVAVKDNLAVAGTSTLLGTGSPEPVADRDAELVQRLRRAGLLIVGKTHLPELALWGVTESRSHGVTRNPWRLDRTPGGSSGGSAAAVAAGLVPAAHATDGLGSIRIPAACCGLVGLKPTHGLLPVDPDPDHWFGLSHAGFLTRTVEDTRLLLDAVLGGDRFQRATATSRLRIGWTTRGPVAPTSVHPQVRQAFTETVRRLRELGHRVGPVSPPYGELLHVMLPRYLAGAAADLAQLADPAATEARTRRVAAVGRALPRRVVHRARVDGARAAGRLQSMFDRIDVLVQPTLAAPPIAAGRLRNVGLARTLATFSRFVPFTQAWNISGQPAVSVPAGWTADGLPIGVQLVARRGADHTLLALAGELQQATGWPNRRPRLD